MDIVIKLLGFSSGLILGLIIGFCLGFAVLIIKEVRNYFKRLKLQGKYVSVKLMDGNQTLAAVSRVWTFYNLIDIEYNYDGCYYYATVDPRCASTPTEEQLLTIQKED